MANDYMHTVCIRTGNVVDLHFGSKICFVLAPVGLGTYGRGIQLPRIFIARSPGYFLGRNDDTLGNAAAKSFCQPRPARICSRPFGQIGFHGSDRVLDPRPSSDAQVDKKTDEETETTSIQAGGPVS